MPPILTVLVVILVISFLVGGFGHTRDWGYAGWSPFGIVVVIFILWMLFGGGSFHSHHTLWR